MSIGGISKCGVECQLIGKSCSALLQDEIDADDLSAALWKNKMDVKTLKVTCLFKYNYLVQF